MDVREPPPPTVSPWPRWLHGPGGDVVLAVAVAALQVVGSTFAADEQLDRLPLDALGYALLLAGPLALVARRRRPGAVLVAVFAVTAAYLGVGYPFGPVFVSFVLAFFTAALAGRRAVTWAVLAAAFVSFLWFGHGQRPALLEAVAVGTWLLVLGGAGELLRSRRERAVEAVRRHEEEARRRASDERLRIARELHDVLAHDISLINVQAGVALHLVDEQPEQARVALAAIKDASKDALGELRSALDLLRGGAEGGDGEARDRAPRAPAPGLGDIGALVARAEAAGLAVRLDTEGTPRAVPAAVDLAGYRIVQEGLTNVVRHAGPASARVRLAYGPDDLVVQVDDDGAGPPPGSEGGSGIAGMRERVRAVGGRLEAGSRPGRGFRLRAWLPLPGSAP